MKEKYIITIDRPIGVTITEMREYIADAVHCMGGSRRPPGGYGPEDDGDPMFGFHECKVKRAR